MPTEKLLLVGSYNTRSIDGSMALSESQDQQFLNCTFDVATNPVTGKATVYVEKRPGWGLDSVVAAGSASTGLIKPQAFNATITAFGETNSTIYWGTTSVGAITGRALYFTETLISAVSYVVIKSSDGTGWYYVDGAKDVTAYTADGNNSTTITDIKIAGANSTAGLYPGQLLAAATNIVAGTRIVSVDSGAFSAVLDTATTGGAFADLAITKTPIAKITDADFITTGTAISAFAEMDGYLFYSTDDGYLRNSDLNSVTAYSALGFVSPSASPDKPLAVARQKNVIVVLGGASKEVFQNAGLSTAPLVRVAHGFDRIGTISQRSVTTLENDIFYVSGPAAGDMGVYRIRGIESQKISTPSVDRIIGTAALLNAAIYASSFRLGGYPYAAFFISTALDGIESYLLLESGDFFLQEDDASNLILEGTAAQTASFVRMMVYNAGLGIWSEWDCTESTFITGIGAGTGNQIIATSRVETGGKVYRMAPASDGELYQDDGSAYSMVIRTIRVYHGTNKRKTISEIRLVGDQQESGEATLEASDDGYQTWYTLGTFDLTQASPKITRCGSYIGGRAYRLTHSDNAPFRATALEIDYQAAA